MKLVLRSSRSLAARRLRQRRADLEHAADYPAWREIALELDQLEGLDAWRDDETSDDYDALLIRDRLAELRRLRASGDARQLAFNLHEGLHGNLGNMANPRLYAVARVGTKQLIEDYTREVARCLDFLCAGDFADFTLAHKLEFFQRTATAFGRSALLLSGGGTLGMFHLGVIKALHTQQLLPKVISGASAGSIVAGTLAGRLDAEIDALLQPDGLDLTAFRALGLREALRDGAMMSADQLEKCLRANIGDGDFASAYARSGRIVNVTVSPAEAHQSSRVLNYLTAPHALIHRAVLASCAVPGLFPPVMLLARDYEGQVLPYMPGKRWVDGTLSADLPMLRLARLHNVNHYIVSQTNPHVVPFMAQLDREALQRRGVAPLVAELIKHGGAGALRLARKHLDPYGSIGLLRTLDGVVHQRYAGDINIYPPSTPQRLLRTFSNPRPEDMARYIRSGERATWPRIERIRIQTRISRTLDDCLRLLQQAEQELLHRRDTRRRAALRAVR